MDAHSVSTETFSYSRLLVRGWHDIFNHRLQAFRWMLGLTAGFHLAPNLGKLYWHYSTHHPTSFLPDFLAFCLSVAARMSWIFLFRDPATFLQFRRPGKAYQWTVCGAVALTTLPNSVVHIWALKTALANDTILLAGVVSAVLALVLLVPTIGLVWWMAWRFLLGHDESDGEFEPISKNIMFTAAHRWKNSVPMAEPYTDNTFMSSTRTLLGTGYLSQAYKQQRLQAQEPLPVSSSTERLETPSLEEEHTQDAGEPEQPLSDASGITSTIDIRRPPRCKTIARFEYLPQDHHGPHSWLSYPLFPLVLSIYATILLIGLPIWIYEDRQYKLRTPSPALKKSLFMPLGMYLLSFYALKHRLRASLFERFHMPPPEPWRKMLSILPSWLGTGGTFRNMETGKITVYDPRRRAFPWRAYHQPALICSHEYLAAYNASPATCAMFWGHSGRSVKTELRFRPTIHRIGFLCIATYITWQGFWNMIFYNVPNVYEEVLKHRNNIQEEDILRILRILQIWQTFVFSGLGFILLSMVFGIASILSMFVLFCKAVWQYVPQEEKQRIMREAREREQIRTGGRIRLE